MERPFQLQLSYDELQLIQSALYEYTGHRTPVQEYMDRRYPQNTNTYTESFRKRKQEDVTKRIELAKQLRDRTFDAVRETKKI